MMPKLDNPRWEAFSKATASGRKRGEAYLDAGYKAQAEPGGKTRRKVATDRGSTLYRTHPEIKARVAELQEELRENSLKVAQVDREWVMNGLKDNYDRAMQAKPVLDREGNETGEWVYAGAVANKSLELGGKELGMFKDIHVIQNMDEMLEGLTPQQLREHIRAAATEVGLRMVHMNEEQTREWIVKNAPRVGLRVVGADPSGEADGGDQEEEAGGVRAVPEASGVPSTRLN